MFTNILSPFIVELRKIMANAKQRTEKQKKEPAIHVTIPIH